MNLDVTPESVQPLGVVDPRIRASRPGGGVPPKIRDLVRPSSRARLVLLDTPLRVAQPRSHHRRELSWLHTNRLVPLALQRSDRRVLVILVRLRVRQPGERGGELVIQPDRDGVWIARPHGIYALSDRRQPLPRPIVQPRTEGGGVGVYVPTRLYSIRFLLLFGKVRVWRGDLSLPTRN